MKPLHVALIVKNSPETRKRADNQAGYFSYDVPEFTWEYLVPGKGVRLSLKALQKQGVDICIHVDGGNWLEYTHRAIPVVYYSVDSTLSQQHYWHRLAQARKADLVLVEHDQRKRFRVCDKVRQWPFCSNDRLFYPREKTTDVAFHCGSGGVPNSERARVRELLRRYCERNGYSYRCECLSVPAYAESLGSARVVVNVPKAPINRPHRVIDAMASGAALLTSPIPDVSGEDREPGRDYWTFESDDELIDQIDRLLAGEWQAVAAAGYAWAVPARTWAVQATVLREMIAKELNL